MPSLIHWSPRAAAKQVDRRRDFQLFQPQGQPESAPDQCAAKTQHPQDNGRPAPDAAPFRRAAAAAPADMFTAQGPQKIHAGDEAVAGLAGQGTAQGRLNMGRQVAHGGGVRSIGMAGEQFTRQHAQGVLVAGRVRFAAFLP